MQRTARRKAENAAATTAQVDEASIKAARKATTAGKATKEAKEATTEAAAATATTTSNNQGDEATERTVVESVVSAMLELLRPMVIAVESAETFIREKAANCDCLSFDRREVDKVFPCVYEAQEGMEGMLQSELLRACQCAATGETYTTLWDTTAAAVKATKGPRQQQTYMHEMQRPRHVVQQLRVHRSIG